MPRWWGWNRRADASISVVIAPSGAHRTHEFRLSLRTLQLLALLLFLLCLSIITILAVFGSIYRRATHATQLSVEVDSLRAELVQLSDLEVRLEELSSDRRRLLELAGVEDLSPTGSSAPDTAKDEDWEWRAPSAWKPSPPTEVPHQGPISRGFRADDPIHSAIDVPGPIGAPIRASGGGVVVRAETDAIFGNVLVIDHGDGLQTLYGHNDELLVAKGDSVMAGQPIAKLGNTGMSSAPHLHFEVIHNGIPENPLNYVRGYATR